MIYEFDGCEYDCIRKIGLELSQVKPAFVHFYSLYTFSLEKLLEKSKIIELIKIPTKHE